MEINTNKESIINILANNHASIISTALNDSSLEGITPKKVVTVQEIDLLAKQISTEKIELTEAIAIKDINVEHILEALTLLGASERMALLGDVHQFITITPEKMQQLVAKVLAEEINISEQAFQTAQLPDEIEIKQIGLAVQVILGSSLLKDAFNNSQSNVELKENEIKSTGELKSNQFIGIISSDILLALSSIVRKVLSELNISDRRISADFLSLNAKMVEAAADSTIKEGEKAFYSSLAGFCTSFTVSLGSGLVQAKSLHTQLKSTNTNLVKANQNSALTDNLKALSQSGASTKNNTISLKGKDGSSIDMVDSPSSTQKNLVNQRNAESAQKTNKLGLAESQEHDRIVNKSRTYSSIAEQGGRLSDNAGQMVTSGTQISVKEEEANKMKQQATADIARTISADKDKQVDKDKDLVKQMSEYLREIREANLRTFQSVVRG